MGGKTSKKHNKMVKYYGQKDIIEEIVEDEIKRINLETPLNEIFRNCDSYKEPDIIAFSYDDKVYVGELKGNYNRRALERARIQMGKYLHEMDRLQINAEGFIIVGGYLEFIES